MNKSSLIAALMMASSGALGSVDTPYGSIGPRDGKGSAKRDTDKARARRKEERKGRKAARK